MNSISWAHWGLQTKKKLHSFSLRTGTAFFVSGTERYSRAVQSPATSLPFPRCNPRVFAETPLRGVVAATPSIHDGYMCCVPGLIESYRSRTHAVARHFTLSADQSPLWPPEHLFACLAPTIVHTFPLPLPSSLSFNTITFLTFPRPGLFIRCFTGAVFLLVACTSE